MSLCGGSTSGSKVLTECHPYAPSRPLQEPWLRDQLLLRLLRDLFGLDGPLCHGVLFHVVLSIGHLKMLQEMLSDLNDVIGSKDQNQKEERFKGKMTEFLFEHQEHFRLTRSFGELFSMHNFVMVVGASVIIVCSLVILVDEFWLLGFVMVFIGFWQILFITLLGTAYETSCEEFEKSTYSVNWYLLAPKQRKAWRLVIQMAQNPRSIPIGRIWKANLNSFIKVRGTAADN